MRQNKILRSSLATYIDAFLQEKYACGYRYTIETAMLRRFDKFLYENDCPDQQLPRTLIEKWMSKQPYESPANHKIRQRIINQFARYLCQHGLKAYVVDTKLAPVVRFTFVPYIFTQEEICRFLQMADRLPYDSRSPIRHLIIPEVFRLLYGCGLRISEVLQLHIEDVDIDEGVLTIRQGKFRKDRLVPIALPLIKRLRRYAEAVHFTPTDSLFFPNPLGGVYNIGTFYHIFRRILYESGIPHGGRGKGPRLHDLRHTFAVHCLERWYHEGEDLNAKLPLLVTYLGHNDLSGTQRYLRLTPKIFPDINARLDEFFKQISSGGTSNETN